MVALVILLLALPLHAATARYGPIVVTTLPPVSSAGQGYYFENRFELRNTARQPQQVQLTIRSDGWGNQGDSTTTKRVEVPASATMRVVMLQPLFGSGPRELAVEVNGNESSNTLSLPAASAPYGRSQSLLMSRNFNEVALRGIIDKGRSYSEQEWSRADLPGADWSTSWLAYERFAGILMTPSDWMELSPAAQAAIWRRVRLGGSIVFSGMPPELPLSGPGEGAVTPEGTAVMRGRSGFGSIWILPENGVYEPWVADLENTWKSSAAKPEPSGEPASAMPLLRGKSFPAGRLFGALALFALLAGPVNFIVLARRNRRLWVFWTVPALAIITTFLLIATTLFTEGLLMVASSSSLTLLDEQGGEATTVGWGGFYSTFAPNRKIRFDAETAISPMRRVGGADTDLTDGQRLGAGWVGSRVSTYFAFRKSEPRRERVPVRFEEGRVLATNGLGVTIKSLWVAAGDGTIYSAKNISPGAEVVLTPDKKEPRVVATPVSPPELVADTSLWPTLPDRLTNAPTSVLQPGTYLAILGQSPFVDRALDSGWTDSQAAVLGQMRGAHAF